MISKQEFYRLYNRNSPENHDREMGEITNRIYRRDISLHVAYFFAKNNISANQTTLFYFTLSIVANILFTIPSFLTIISLIILYEIVYILDNVDGQLARYYGTQSKFGEMLDIAFDILMLAFFISAFAIRLFFETHNYFFLILGNVAAISYVLEAAWVEKSSDIVGKFEEKTKQSMINKLRKLYISLDNMTVISITILIIYSAKIFFPSINLIEIFFVFYVVFLFALKIVFRILAIYMKTQSVTKKEWKGWKNNE